jgi:hypothetical protein
VKVITPAGLLREAADVLAPIWSDVVVIGAAALQVVLADDLSARGGPTSIALAITPTRDVDVAVEMSAAEVSWSTSSKRGCSRATNHTSEASRGFVATSKFSSSVRSIRSHRGPRRSFQRTHNSPFSPVMRIG